MLKFDIYLLPLRRYSKKGNHFIKHVCFEGPYFEMNAAHCHQYNRIGYYLLITNTNLVTKITICFIVYTSLLLARMNLCLWYMTRRKVLTLQIYKFHPTNCTLENTAIWKSNVIFFSVPGSPGRILSGGFFGITIIFHFIKKF